MSLARHTGGLSPSPSAYLSPRHRLERQRPDGWPVRRSAMRVAACVRARMAEDAAALIEARGADAVIAAEDFRRLGWTPSQIAAHALDATHDAVARLAEAA